MMRPIHCIWVPVWLFALVPSVVVVVVAAALLMELVTVVLLMELLTAVLLQEMPSSDGRLVLLAILTMVAVPLGMAVCPELGC